MCLIALRWAPGTGTPLILAANRDEFHDRPTRALHWWNWPTGPLAGRDQQAGGTWLALRRDGRFAALTNYRDPAAASGDRTRGELVVQWLESDLPAAEFGDQIRARVPHYSPFNLLYGHRDMLWIVGTHTEAAPVEPGVHALSNGLLDTPWPKSIRAVRRMQDWIAGDIGNIDSLLDLLDDREPAADHELPDTGVGAEFERLLSAPFIVSPRYGTRSSTALTLGQRGRIAERQFDPAGKTTGERIFGWQIE
jgi:uncharacterized protein with NRDE domain